MEDVQINKEALAIVFGVKRYHKYLFGRRFMIYTDHKPLMYIFDEHKTISATPSARVQRWVLTLSGYHYSIAHRPGHPLGNADGLSRLPLPAKMEEVPQPADSIFLIERMNSSLVTFEHIKAWTEKDPTLSKVLKAVLQGWPDCQGPESTSDRRGEISVEDGCLLWCMSNSASKTLCKGSGRDTRGSPRGEQNEKLRDELHVHTFGGHAKTQISNRQLRIALCVNRISRCQWRPRCSPGTGQRIHGHAFTLTMLAMMTHEH